MVGVIVAVLALFLSAFFGILGGYLGGWLDEVFSLFTNVVLILPGLPLMIVIGSYVQQRGLLLISIILRDHLVGGRRACAGLADPVHPHPRLRAGRTDRRREGASHHRRGDPAEPAAGDVQRLRVRADHGDPRGSSTN